MVTRTPLTLLLVLLTTIVTASAADPRPGLLVRLYDIGVDVPSLPELAPDQKPNVVLVVPTLDLRSDRRDFEPLENRFLTEVVGVLTVDKAGTYRFRLLSDDGSKLWLDGRLQIDNDGLHGPTPKDSEPIDLTAGPHELHIWHLQAGGGAQLTLQWQRVGEGEAPAEPKAPASAEFYLIPAALLSHSVDASKETASGQKKIIPPLRRGRPGDGTPVAGLHPWLIERSRYSEARSSREQAAPHSDTVNLDLRERLQLCALGRVGRFDGPVIWLPWEASTAALCGPTTFSYGQFLIGNGAAGSLARVLVDERGKTDQGCALRFSEGHPVGFQQLLIDKSMTLQLRGPLSGVQSGRDEIAALQVLGQDGRHPFEMLAVRVRKNGFEIEFTKPLDPRVGWDPESYYIEQWPYDCAKGIPPHRDGVVYPVTSASVLADRRMVFLEIENLKPSHVVYIRLLPPCLSEDGELPWSTEAWYTLNVMPEVRPEKVLPPPAKEPQNFLTDEEQQQGWRLLFDGQSPRGWHVYKKDISPAGWQAKDGCLVRVAPAGDIITDDEFQDFELSLEWRISPGGNSGIMYRVTEDHGAPWETGPEYQILDNAEHPDGRDPLTSAASCYGLYAPPRDVTVPVGFFNKARIVVQGNHVEHWLNGVKVVEYELHSPEWNKLYKDSKFNKMPDYGTRPKGKIDLQDHGDKVWYRNIKIRITN